MLRVRRFLSPAAAVTVYAILAAALLGGCGPRAGAGAPAAANAAFAVDLPALTVTVDAAGIPHLDDVPLSQLGDALDPGMLDILAMSPEFVQAMTESNIQHIQVSNTPGGLVILVNGEPVPSLVWDPATLAASAELAQTSMASIPLLEQLLQLGSAVGIGLTVRFPVAEGREPIPVVVQDQGNAAAILRAGRNDLLTSVDSAPSITIPVYYESDGSWRVGDLTDTEWTNLTGLPWYALRLQTPVIERAMAAGIEQVQLTTDAAGLHVAVNGRELPYLGWGHGEMQHALALAGQLGAWEELDDGGYDSDAIRAVLAAFLPVVQSAETTIVVHFPTSAATSP